MDAAYTNIVNNEMAARLGQSLITELNTLSPRWDKPPGGQYSGWYQYFDRDIRGCYSRKKGKRPGPFQPHLLREGPPEPLPLGGLDRDSGCR